MKTKIFVSILLLFCVFLSFSQNKEKNNLKLIREEIKSSDSPGKVKYIMYEDENWKNNFKPKQDDLGYELNTMILDSSKVYPIVRKEISGTNYISLNKKNWLIITRLTGYGKIVSVQFAFQDDSGVNSEEFARISERLKNEVEWKVLFNKKVTDLFYLGLSFPGPKL